MMPRAQIQARALLISALLLHELQNSLEKKEKNKRRWIMKWIRRRHLYGASNNLLIRISGRGSFRTHETSQNESWEV
jgi:type II secretory pathway component PulL